MSEGHPIQVEHATQNRQATRKVRKLDSGSLRHTFILVDEPAQSVTSMNAKVGLVGFAEGGSQSSIRTVLLPRQDEGAVGKMTRELQAHIVEKIRDQLGVGGAEYVNPK